MECIYGGIIDYSKYFRNPVEHRKYSESTSEYSPDGVYSEPMIIYCWIGGSEKFQRGPDSQLTVSSKTYRTLTPVKPKDLLNGQVVIKVDTNYSLDGVTIEFYKAYVE